MDIILSVRSTDNLSVQKARSKKTIFLMRIAWLEDSILLNESKNRPLDELNKKYTWEIKHAQKVAKHRDIKKAEKKKEAFVARMLAAKQEREQSEEADVGRQVVETPDECGVHKDDIPCEDLQDGDKPATDSTDSTKIDLHIESRLKKQKLQNGVRKRKELHKKIVDAERLQQIFKCGKIFPILTWTTIHCCHFLRGSRAKSLDPQRRISCFPTWIVYADFPLSA